MSSTAYTRTQADLAPEGALYWKRHQSGRKTTGPDRERPQPYTLVEGKALSWRKWNTGVTDWNPKDPSVRSIHRTLPFSTEAQSLRNAAYGKLKEAIVDDNAAMGVFLAEAGESFGMIQKRAMGLYRAYRNLRKGNFRGALQELSVSPKRKHRGLVRNAAHEASGLWLEYWFGWSPAISDIYTAVDQLSQPPPDISKVKAGVSRPFKDVDTRWGSQVWEGKIKIRTSCNVRLVNPNAFLNSQLGLTNPATVAWELIPFSFLADWCFDVSSYIDSYTDFMGLELTEKQTTEICKGQWKLLPASSQQTGTYVAAQTFMERRLSLARPLPNLEVLSNLGVSKTRAASAVSLLTQILRV